MAEVSNLPRREEFDLEDELDHTNFDDFAPICPHCDIWDPLYLELDDYYQEPEFPEFHYGNSIRTNSVADRFEEALLTEDPVWETDSVGVEEDSASDFGIGSPPLGMDSPSISEELEVNSRITTDDVVAVDDDDDSYVGFGVRDNISQISGNEGEEFEWEDVNETIHTEDRETLDHAVDQIEEISVSADVMSDGENPNLSEEDEQANIGWEVLLAMDDLERDIGLDYPEANSPFEIPRIYLPGNLIMTREGGTLYGHLVVNNAVLNGKPPAAKSAADNLPSLILTNEELWRSGDVVCAVCKENLVVGDKATRMPCCHLFHGECILPWLRIRNTCPVCRYELPTDDVDYERRKSARGGRNESV